MFVALPPEAAGAKQFIRRYGSRKTLIYWHAHITALRAMRHIIIRERIPCQREDAAFLNFAGRGNVEELLQDYRLDKRLHRRVKLLLDRELRRELHTPFFLRGEVAHPGLAVNPLQYAQNLSNVLARRGVRIYEHTPLLEERHGIAITPHGKIRFRQIIYATDNYEFSSRFRRLKTTVAVTNRLSRRALRALGLADRDMFADWQRRSCHYARITPDNRLLVGYGDHQLRSGESSISLWRPHLRNIKMFIQRLFPDIPFRIACAWSGTFGIVRGLLPLVRFRGNRVFLGGSGLQVTSTLIARYAAARLLGKRQLLDQIFGRR